MPNATPNTIFSGTAGPDDHVGPDRVVGRLGAYVAFAVFLPVAVIVWGVWAWVFHLFRTKWWTPAVVFGVVLVAMMVLGYDLSDVVVSYFQPWRELFAAENPLAWFLGHWWWWLWKQLWLGVLVGCAYATVALGWKWYRRPKWKERTIRPGPFLWWRMRQSRRRISMDEGTPGSGVTLGVSADVRDDRFAGGSPGAEYGSRVVIDDAELAGHFLVTGGSGSGKSLALSTPLRLADGGWVTMGNVRVGDMLVGSGGGAVEVVYRSEVFHGRVCYRVTFDDGYHVVADGEHLWSVCSGADCGDGEDGCGFAGGVCGGSQVVTTQFLFLSLEESGGSRRWFVPPVADGVVCGMRSRRVVGVRRVESVPVRCVGVDAEDSLFLAGEGMVPTHNTTSMLMGMRDVIKRGRGLIVVDCKGGPDIPAQLEEWCGRYGRRFLHWSMVDPEVGYDGPADSPAYYDPISRGDSSRKKDLLLAARKKWDVEYYKSVTGHYLQTLFEVQRIVPDPETPDTLVDVCKLMSPEKLLTRAKPIPKGSHPELVESLQRMMGMSEMERSAVGGMYRHLFTILQSTAGRWLRCDPNPVEDERQNINLRQVADRGEVVVFSLDSSNYEETAEMLAGLIIQDLKTLSSELRRKPSQYPVHVYVDEFSAVDATNILGLLSKARDAKIFTTVSTQALADLARKDPAFLDQVVGIVAGFIIHRTNSEDDARVFAGLSGVEKKTSERVQVEQTTSFAGSLGAAANKGSAYLEEVDDYAVPVGVFQKLERGECVFLANSPKRRYVNPVQVVMESPAVSQRYAEGSIVGGGDEYEEGEDGESEENLVGASGAGMWGEDEGEYGSWDNGARKGGYVVGEEPVGVYNSRGEDVYEGEGAAGGEAEDGEDVEDVSAELEYRVSRSGKIVPLSDGEGFQDYTRKGGARKKLRGKASAREAADKDDSVGEVRSDPYTYPNPPRRSKARDGEPPSRGSRRHPVADGSGGGEDEWGDDTISTFDNGVPLPEEYSRGRGAVTIPEDFQVPPPPKPGSRGKRRKSAPPAASSGEDKPFWDDA